MKELTKYDSQSRPIEIIYTDDDGNPVENQQPPRLYLVHNREVKQGAEASGLVFRQNYYPVFTSALTVQTLRLKGLPNSYLLSPPVLSIPGKQCLHLTPPLSAFHNGPLFCEKQLEQTLYPQVSQTHHQLTDKLACFPQLIQATNAPSR